MARGGRDSLSELMPGSSRSGRPDIGPTPPRGGEGPNGRLSPRTLPADLRAS